MNAPKPNRRQLLASMRKISRDIEALRDDAKASGPICYRAINHVLASMRDAIIDVGLSRE